MIRRCWTRRTRRIPLRNGGFRAVIRVCVMLALVAGCRKNDVADNATPAATTQAAESGTSEGNASAAEGKWVEVRRETLRRFTPAVGTLRARQTTSVSSQVAGRVESVLVDVGDVVKKGQVLVRLDQTFIRLEVEQLKAGLAAARAAVVAAQIDVQETDRERKRKTELFQRDSAAPKEKDDAVAYYDRALAGQDAKKALLQQTERQLQYAEERLRETSIVAPYDAVVTKRLVDPGEPVAVVPATRLLEIQEVAVLYLEFSLPQELLGVVKEKTPIAYEVEGLADFKGTGTVATVFPAIDEMTRSFRCRVVVENPDLKLRPGLLARVRVEDRVVKDALVVPKAALSQTASGWQVLASNDGHPVPRSVTVGQTVDDKVEILSGLKEGDRVLLREGGM